MYTLEQLKIFAAVCEHGSLSAAARALGRAQSGISQSIANLEIELDQTLFVREKAGVTLTEAGQALLPEAQALLRQNHYFEQRLQALAQGAGHELSLAVEISVWNDGMADALARLEQRFPYLPVKLLTASTFDIAQMVENGDVQLGVCTKIWRCKKTRISFFSATTALSPWPRHRTPWRRCKASRPPS